jgi:hypothetical protein
MCERNGLVLLYLPPHSSHFLQYFDLSIFGFTKRQVSAINRMEDVNSQTSHILQILNGFMSTAIPANIIKSFTNSGTSIRRERQQIFCYVTAETVCLYPAEEGMNAFGPEAVEQGEIHLEVLPPIVLLWRLENTKHRENTLKKGLSENF